MIHFESRSETYPLSACADRAKRFTTACNPHDAKKPQQQTPSCTKARRTEPERQRRYHDSESIARACHMSTPCSSFSSSCPRRPPRRRVSSSFPSLTSCQKPPLQRPLTSSTSSPSS